MLKIIQSILGTIFILLLIIGLIVWVISWPYILIAYVVIVFLIFMGYVYIARENRMEDKLDRIIKKFDINIDDDD